MTLGSQIAAASGSSVNSNINISYY